MSRRTFCRAALRGRTQRVLSAGSQLDPPTGATGPINRGSKRSHPKTMQEGLISAVHAARRAALAAREGVEGAAGPSSAAAEELSAEVEVELVLSQLKQLDQLAECNELDLVQRLKRALMQHVPPPSSQDFRSDDSTGAAVLGLNSRGGLDTVRKQILHDIEACVNNTIDTAESTALLTTGNLGQSALTSSKKQKATGYFSFNFDDLPLFEPLEHTLVLLREDPLATSALSKLMVLDVGELAEHPQWSELVSLLLSSLIASNSSHALSASSVLRLHVRFMHGFEGEQRVDIAQNLLKHLWRCWMSNEGGNTYTLTSSSSCNVAILLDIIEFVSPQVQYCNSKQADQFVASLLLLLAKGVVNQTAVLDLVTEKSAASIATMMRSKPMGITIHALNSSLLTVLHERLQQYCAITENFPPNMAKQFVVHACLFYSLARPLLKMTQVLELICSGRLGSEYTWNGQMSSSPGVALTEIMRDSNKLFTHLACPSFPRLQDMLMIESAQGSRTAHVELLSSCTNLLVRVCHDNTDLSNKDILLLLLEHAADSAMNEFNTIAQSLFQVAAAGGVNTPKLLAFIHGLQRIARRRCTSSNDLDFWSRMWISASDLALKAANDFSGQLSLRIAIYTAWCQHLRFIDAEKSTVEIPALFILLNRLATYGVDLLKKQTETTSLSRVLLQFIATLVSCKVVKMSSAEILRPLYNDIIGLLLHHLTAQDSIHETTDVILSGLLFVASDCGSVTITQHTAMASIIKELGHFFDCCDVWENADIPISQKESQPPFWKLVCGLAAKGFIDEAFSVVLRSSTALRTICFELDISSAVDVARNSRVHETLSSEGFFPFLQQFMSIAKTNPPFALALTSC